MTQISYAGEGRVSTIKLQPERTISNGYFSWNPLTCIFRFCLKLLQNK